VVSGLLEDSHLRSSFRVVGPTRSGIVWADRRAQAWPAVGLRG